MTVLFSHVDWLGLTVITVPVTSQASTTKAVFARVGALLDDFLSTVRSVAEEIVESQFQPESEQTIPPLPADLPGQVRRKKNGRRKKKKKKGRRTETKQVAVDPGQLLRRVYRHGGVQYTLVRGTEQQCGGEYEAAAKLVKQELRSCDFVLPQNQQVGR